MGRTRRVMVVGSGGREHALAWALARAPSVGTVLVAPGNAGTEAEPSETAAPIRTAALERPSPDELLAVARRHEVELVVVGPEAPLCAGAVDALTDAGILAFGPTAAAARLEGSKVFLKQFAARHAIPTAPFAVFTDAAQAERYIRDRDRPVVVKADGLCGGKGVIVPASADEAVHAAHEMLVAGRFGDAGRTIVVEDRLEGSELSVHALTDGRRWTLLPVARDHKRVDDGDRGPNTGGMGAYAPVPVDPSLLARIETEIVRPSIEGMAAEGTPFRGVLYAGLMVGPGGAPYLLEHNVRFGDPECQALMPLFEGDLASLLASCASGHLDASAAPIAPDRHSLCVVLAAPGYPDRPRTGAEIRGLDAVAAPVGAAEATVVFHAGTVRDGERIVTAGGRVLGVTGVGANAEAARQAAYGAVARIDFDAMHYRRDIGRRGRGAQEAE